MVVYLFMAGMPAIAGGPDSLLRQSLPQRFITINRLHNEAAKAGKERVKQLVGELRSYFAMNGNAEDQLLLRVCLITKAPEKPELFEAELLSVLKEAKQLKNVFMTAKAHHIMGLYYYYKTRQYNLAFRHLLSMVNLIKDLDEERYPGHTYAIYFTARAHYDFYDYPNAIRYGKILMREKGTIVKSTYIFNSCMLGMTYLKLGQFPLARAYFRWGLRSVPTVFSDHRLAGWRGILTGDIGLSYVEQQAYDQAIPYLEQGLTETEKTELWDNALRFSSKLALIYLERKQLRQAGIYARKALLAAKRIKEPLDRKSIYMAEPYQVMSAYSRAVGNYESAMLYADSAAAANSLWKQQMDVTFKHKAEIEVEQERFVAREKWLQQEKERQILIRNSVIGLTILSFVVALLLYNRQRLKNRHRQLQLQAERQVAEAELQSALAQLNQFRQGMQQMNQLINQYEPNPETLADSTYVYSSQYPLLNDLRHSVLLTDDNWHTFTELFEKVHPGFFVRLRSKHPDLTPAETRYMALSRLGYSAREMAGMLGVSSGAIRQYRHTIRRKLALPDDARLEELALQI